MTTKDTINILTREHGTCLMQLQRAEAWIEEAKRFNNADGLSQRQKQTRTFDAATDALERCADYWNARRRANQAIKDHSDSAFFGDQPTPDEQKIMEYHQSKMAELEEKARQIRREAIILTETATGQSREEAERTADKCTRDPDITAK